MSAEKPIIVVGLDASVRAPAVLAAAQALARGNRGRLVLLRVVGMPTDMPDEALAMTPSEIPVLLERSARGQLAALVAANSAAYVVAQHVRIGSPWEGIVEEARASSADFIVIGSHGYAGLDRVLGTTAAKVVNHAPCSTLVVR